MSNLALFVSPSKVKIETALGGSVDDNLIAPYIKSAQQRWILPALGQALYDALVNAVINADATTAETALLNEYISPALVPLAFADLLPFLRVRMVNNSTVIMQTEQSAPASYADIKPLIDSSTEMGQFHIQRLINYVDANTGLYPELGTETQGQLRRTRRNYSQGLNLDYNANITLAERLALRAVFGC